MLQFAKEKEGCILLISDLTLQCRYRYLLCTMNCLLLTCHNSPHCPIRRFVSDGDESNPRDAEAGQQEGITGGENAASAPADPNLYQKCYDYYMNFYKCVSQSHYLTLILS